MSPTPSPVNRRASNSLQASDSSPQRTPLHKVSRVEPHVLSMCKRLTPLHEVSRVKSREVSHVEHVQVSESSPRSLAC
eukprot:3493055-Pyramimonas_sp.AAC.1